MRHVDDLMISQVDPFENTKLITYLMSIYGENMTVKQGKKHTYLGMEFDYSTKGEV